MSSFPALFRFPRQRWPLRNFEWGPGRKIQLNFSVGNLISFVVSGINIDGSAMEMVQGGRWALGQGKLWPRPHFMLLLLLLAFRWQQDNGKNTLGYPAYKIKQTMTRQELGRETACQDGENWPRKVRENGGECNSFPLLEGGAMRVWACLQLPQQALQQCVCHIMTHGPKGKRKPSKNLTELQVI